MQRSSHNNHINHKNIVDSPKCTRGSVKSKAALQRLVKKYDANREHMIIWLSVTKIAYIMYNVQEYIAVQ